MTRASTVALAAVASCGGVAVAPALATALVVAGPALAIVAAVWFAWSHSLAFRWLPFGLVSGLALYGAATAGAMLRVGTVP